MFTGHLNILPIETSRNGMFLWDYNGKRVKLGSNGLEELELRVALEMDSHEYFVFLLKDLLKFLNLDSQIKSYSTKKNKTLFYSETKRSQNVFHLNRYVILF